MSHPMQKSPLVFNFLQRLCLRLLALSIVLSGLTAGTASRAAKYPSEFEWQTLYLGSVEVHFPRGYETYARYCATHTLSSMDTLTSWLGRRATPRKVHLVLHPEQNVNYAYAIIAPNRMELPLQPALGKGIRPQNGYYLERVIDHELTHIYQFSVTSGITRYLRPVFGDVIAPAAISPSWIMEGMAIAAESRNDGGRLHSSYHWMLWRTPQLQGKGWTLEQMASPGTVQPPANRAYIGGAVLVDALMKEHLGVQRMRLWLDQQAKYPGLHWVSFKKSFTGRHAGKVYNSLQKFWQTRNRDFHLNRMKRGFHSGYPLAGEKRASFRSPVWLDQRTLVSLKSSYNNPSQLTSHSILDVNRSNLPASNPGQKIRYTGNSPHNQITSFKGGVIYSEVRNFGQVPSMSRTFLYFMKDGKRKSVGQPQLKGWAPAWSEKRSQLAYIAQSKSGSLELRLVRLDKDATVVGFPEVIYSTTLSTITDPSFSKSGDQLAFVIDPGDGERVMLYSFDDKSFTELKIKGARCTWDPSFSPDGSLWVSADPGAVFDLFQFFPDTESAVRRTRVLTGAVEPEVSPGGNEVAYCHYTSEGFSLAVLDSTRWAVDSVGVSYQEVELDTLLVESEVLDNTLPGRIKEYNSLLNSKPRFWLPMVYSFDELAYGALVYGNDPLSLLEWRIGAASGSESRKAHASLLVRYKGLPVDVTVSSYLYTDEAYKYVRAGDSWTRYLDYTSRFDGIGMISRTFSYDDGPWSGGVTPFFGYSYKQYKLQTAPGASWSNQHFHGWRTGFSAVRGYGARRDPVPRSLQMISVVGERNINGLGDSNADKLEAKIRVHFPTPVNGIIVAVESAAQSQGGELNYNRVNFLPRTTDSDFYPFELQYGKLARLTGELHFPLLFPDYGIGLGIFRLERVTGTLFAEGSTGWGKSVQLSDWIDNHGIAAYGAEIGAGCFGFYQAYFKLNAGIAYRTFSEDTSFYVRFRIPVLSSYLSGNGQSGVKAYINELLESVF